jgi:hypothetical protein
MQAPCSAACTPTQCLSEALASSARAAATGLGCDALPVSTFVHCGWWLGHTGWQTLKPSPEHPCLPGPCRGLAPQAAIHHQPSTLSQSKWCKGIAASAAGQQHVPVQSEGHRRQHTRAVLPAGTAVQHMCTDAVNASEQLPVAQ